MSGLNAVLSRSPTARWEERGRENAREDAWTLVYARARARCMHFLCACMKTEKCFFNASSFHIDRH